MEPLVRVGDLVELRRGREPVVDAAHAGQRVVVDAVVIQVGHREHLVTELVGERVRVRLGHRERHGPRPLLQLRTIVRVDGVVDDGVGVDAGRGRAAALDGGAAVLRREGDGRADVVDGELIVGDVPVAAAVVALEVDVCIGRLQCLDVLGEAVGVRVVVVEAEFDDAVVGRARCLAGGRDAEVAVRDGGEVGIGAVPARAEEAIREPRRVLARACRQVIERRVDDEDGTRDRLPHGSEARVAVGAEVRRLEGRDRELARACGRW